MSKFIQGQDRNQVTLFPICLDQAIDSDNEIRVIDAFVEALDLQMLGFDLSHGENGRPAYHPKDLLKLYIYGYLNRVRSSRSLEKECKRNIEVMWLLKHLAPDHNTISNFRRDNPKAIKQVFRQTVRVAQHFNLIGGRLLAGDSTKLRAQNSKKKNYNQKKIDRHLEYIDNKVAEYEKMLAENDGDKVQIKKELKKQQERKAAYKKLEQELKSSGQPQISTSDPDSRHLITRNNITEVAYSVQTSVDEKNNIPIDYKVTNQNDSKAMGNMLQRAKSILRTNQFTALYDKGYHTGSELAIADSLNIPAIVAIPPFSGASHAPDLNYDAEHFIYDQNNDTYTCPQGHILTTNGTWHHAKNQSGKTSYRFKNYTTSLCKACPVKPLCTKSQINGKQIRRSEFAENIENNKTRVKQSEKLYKRRQAIVEHPFGTIKRQWGFNYIITKKYIHRAEADFGLVMTAYNLRRMMNIMGTTIFKAYMGQINLVFSAILTHIKAFRSLYEAFIDKSNHFSAIFKSPLNQLILNPIYKYEFGF